MMGGWLGDLTKGHKSWRAYRPGMVPKPADAFYIEHPAKPNNNHTGRFVEDLGGGKWRCFEGGGGDGTLAQMTVRDLAHFDSYGRLLVGWWDADDAGYAAF